MTKALPVEKHSKSRAPKAKTANPDTAEIAAAGFVLFMLIVFPLFFRNYYIDIQTSKYLAFRTAAIVFLLIILAVEIVTLIARQGKARNEAGMSREFSPAALIQTGKWFLIFSLILAAAIVLSQLTTLWPQDALSGEVSRRMGTKSWLLCIASGAALSMSFRYRKWMKYVLFAGGSLIVLLGILNFWGIDPLGMYENLVKGQHAFFLGTIGNKNVTSNFLCLLVPVALGALYLAEEKTDRILAAILAGLGIYEGFAASSDSFLIGCVGAFLIFLWCSLEDCRKMGRFWNLCVLFYLTEIVMKITLLIGQARGSEAPFFLVFPADGLIGLCMKPSFLIGSGIVLALLILLERKVFAAKENFPYKKIRKILFCVIGAAAVIGILLFIIANVRYGNGAQEASGLWKRLVLPDEFGSNRGYIWKRSVSIYSDFSLKEKLFGCGPDCFLFAAADQYGEEMVALYGAPFTDAHCEFLQMLVTTGILGVIGYFGLLISSMAAALKKTAARPAALIGAAALGAYLLQGIVNNPTVTVTPILFTVLGIMTAVKEQR